KRGRASTRYKNRIGVEEDEHGVSKKNFFRSPKEILEPQEPTKFI
ncbi:12489_t:CDS:1, partial [Gigaspora rosea]